MRRLWLLWMQLGPLDSGVLVIGYVFTWAVVTHGFILLLNVYTIYHIYNVLLCDFFYNKNIRIDIRIGSYFVLVFLHVFFFYLYTYVKILSLFSCAWRLFIYPLPWSVCSYILFILKIVLFILALFGVKGRYFIYSGY